MSRYSTHKRLAFQAISCLREAKHEVTNAVLGGLPPVLTSVYTQPAFQKAYPFWKDILDTLKLASVRPKTPAYQSVSLEIAYTLSPPTSVNPATDIALLRSRIEGAINSKGLVP